MSTVPHEAASTKDEPLLNLLFDYPGADILLRSHDCYHFRVPKASIINNSHIGQSYFPAPSGELEMTSNRKLRVGPSQRKSTNSRSRAWAHLYKLPHVVGGPIL